MNEKAAIEILDAMVGKYFKLEGEYIHIERYTLSVLKDEVVLFTDEGRKVHQLSKLGSQMRAYTKVADPQILENPNNDLPVDKTTEIYEPERIKSSAIKNDKMADTDNEQETENEKIESPKTLTDLRNILMTNISEIKNGNLPLDKAREIVAHSNSIINITKVELEYMKLVKLKNRALK